MVERSECCAAAKRATDHACSYCGKPFRPMNADEAELWRAIDASFCDWNSPRFLATHDLVENEAKAYRLVRKAQGGGS